MTTIKPLATAFAAVSLGLAAGFAGAAQAASFTTLELNVAKAFLDNAVLSSVNGESTMVREVRGHFGKDPVVIDAARYAEAAGGPRVAKAPRVIITGLVGSMTSGRDGIVRVGPFVPGDGYTRVEQCFDARADTTGSLGRLGYLGAYRFVCRPAPREGDVYPLVDCRTVPMLLNHFNDGLDKAAAAIAAKRAGRSAPFSEVLVKGVEMAAVLPDGLRAACTKGVVPCLVAYHDAAQSMEFHEMMSEGIEEAGEAIDRRIKELGL